MLILLCELKGGIESANFPDQYQDFDNISVNIFTISQQSTGRHSVLPK
jgi:hypothetical protein